MALFSDGAISTVGELMAYESALLEVARIEAIDLTAKLGLANEELAVELEAFLARDDSGFSLGQVVVSDALHKWHTFRTLGLIYRDAYNRQLNDRYEGKWKEYDRLASWAQRALYDTGVGMTMNPIPRAGVPAISSVAALAAAATYYLSVSWRAGLAEGAASEVTAWEAAEGTAPVVAAGNPPANATGWNVYAGYGDSGLTRQNDAPLGLAETWTAPASGLREGAPLGNGQAPELFLRPRSVFLRG
jgi:hypothetical protein